MTKLEMFVINDTKAGKPVNPPTLDDNYQTAIRSFSTLVNDAKTVMFAHPEDYHLMHVGYWNPETLTLEGFEAPKSVISAVSVKRPDPQLDLPLDKTLKSI